MADVLPFKCAPESERLRIFKVGRVIAQEVVVTARDAQDALERAARGDGEVIATPDTASHVEILEGA